MSDRVRTRIKFCGMTSPEDVALAVAAGADAVGIIVSASPRRVEPEKIEEILAAVPPFVTAVLVSAGETAVDLRAFARRGVLLQFSGPESPPECERIAGGARYLKAFHVKVEDGSLEFTRARIEAYLHAVALFDSSAFSGASAPEPLYGGTGVAFDWSLVSAVARERPVVISGGLNAGNVGACVRALRPYAVDVRSGIETDGRKDAAKMRAFVGAVRDADSSMDEPPLVIPSPSKGRPPTGPPSSGSASTGSARNGER